MEGKRGRARFGAPASPPVPGCYHQVMGPPRWLPNAISAGRIALVPVWIAVAEMSADMPELLGLLVLLLLALGASDLIDGFIARRYGLATRFGATLDASADKLAQLSFVTYLAWFSEPPLHPLPVWFWLLIVGRDVLLGTGYLVLYSRRGSVDTEHRAHGKIASVLLFALVLSTCTTLPGSIVAAAIGLTAAVIAVSTLDYLRRGFLALRAEV